MMNFYENQINLSSWLAKKEDEDRFIIANEECCESDLEYMISRGWLDSTYLTELKDTEEMNKAVSVFREKMAPSHFSGVIADTMNDNTYTDKKVEVEVVGEEGEGYLAFYEVVFS